MSYLIEPNELLKTLQNEEVRIVDCRFNLGDPSCGKDLYDQEHIAGAVYFHLEEDLSGKVGNHGGRHPLPNLAEFKQKLEEVGVSNNTRVVAYDGGEGAFASRFVWLLSYLGHKHVQILNGGYYAWKQAGGKVDKEIPHYNRQTFHVCIDPTILATYDEVKEYVILQPKDVTLLDSREERRYLGIEEPIDHVAGHIPFARNKMWNEGIKDGSFISAEKQRERFAELSNSQKVIVYCGSGVTAAPNFIALKEAGFDQVKLYVGSFSDWISYEENEVVTKS
ncbi:MULTISPECIES: sulfurtransferase [Bacillaceae]|uniref:Thiosulfate/3-mercaptopyruvate sulfurtransferase n=1 Tax=Peribacillus huizhouensis TaxID=1501239 RepID=A0ABR6CT27_9BACI|nr:MULTISPECIES: sulfurtransferase [Bacillaceae]MBA9027750.1 thiosulfate/3-mercaptopyruvate sulfurtransferase [Peribacillus huizhouensis]